MTSYVPLIVLMTFAAAGLLVFLVWFAYEATQIVREDKARKKAHVEKQAWEKEHSRRINALYDGRFSEL